MDITPVPYCCSEAGTLALSRPDISHAMFIRKQDAIGQLNGKDHLRGLGHKTQILTNCPSCVQGLGRQKGVEPVHLAEALARQIGGREWIRKFKEIVRNPEVVTF